MDKGMKDFRHFIDEMEQTSLGLKACDFNGAYKFPGLKGAHYTECEFEISVFQNSKGMTIR